MSAVSTRFGVGAAWAYAQALVARSVSLLGFLVAGFFLRPEEFGAFAVAAGLLLVAEMLCEQVWSQCWMQRGEQREDDGGALLLLALVSGLLASGLLALGAQPIAAAFGVPAAAGPLLGLALCPLLMAMTAVPTGRLKCRLDFRALTRRTALASGLSVLVGCALLWQGQGVTALVVQMNLYWLVSVLVLWGASREPLRWQLGRPRLRALLGLASTNAVGKLADVTEMRALEYAVAASLGAAALGAFAFAMRLAQTLFQLVANPAFDVTLAAVATAAPAQRAAALSKGLRLVLGLVASALLLLAFWGPPLLAWVYGPRWQAAAGALQVLALAFAGRGLLYLLGVSLQAVGAVAAVMWLSMARALLLLLLCALAVRLGSPSEGFALVYALAALALLPPFWRLAAQRIAGAAGLLARHVPDLLALALLALLALGALLASARLGGPLSPAGLALAAAPALWAGWLLLRRRHFLEPS